MIPKVAGLFMNFIKAGWVKETLLALPRVALLIPKLLGDRRVPLRIRTALLGLGIYLVSPFDIIPDFIPGLGKLDDAVVLLLLVDGVLNQIDEKILLDHWRGRPATLRRLIDVASVVSSFVPQKFRRFLFGKIVSLGERHNR
ncbi:MAG: DUF1232 domain-containing protein [Acidobacteriota bacterium]|jgi:uncharacterized membrane protein YkvA (DUF1232 family)|nr:DUF1232 domain-containing protein [Acidobacteriota bacterium]